jgi:hypothetical protein
MNDVAKELDVILSDMISKGNPSVLSRTTSPNYQYRYSTSLKCPPGTVKSRMNSERAHVIDEIVNTERQYVRDLQVMIKLFFKAYAIV